MPDPKPPRTITVKPVLIYNQGAPVICNESITTEAAARAWIKENGVDGQNYHIVREIATVKCRHTVKTIVELE